MTFVPPVRSSTKDGWRIAGWCPTLSDVQYLRSALGSVRRLVSWRPGLRGPVLLGSGVVVLVVAVAIAVSVADHLRGSATASALGNAASIVRGYVDPILDEADLGIAANPDPQVEAQLTRLVAAGDMRRINVWTRDGRILYSTEPSLRGVRLDIDHDLAEAFAGGSVTEFGVPGDTAHDAELPPRYLEINVPIRGGADANPIGVFEVYLDARPIEQRVADTRRDVFLISLGGGGVLIGLLWLSFAAASRLLSGQNRSLSQLNLQLSAMTDDLRQSEARFRSLIQNSSDVVAVVAADGKIAYESDAMRRVLGHDPNQMLGRPFAERVHPEDAAFVRALLTDLLERNDAEQTCEIRLRHADGSWRWVEAIGQNLMHDPAVGGIVLNFRDVTDRKRLEQQLQHDAFHDPLTGLANRALFADRVTHALTRITRHREERLAILFVDLDDFKLVNDSLGHAAGDDLLVAVAERVRACLRGSDTPSRLGGDEFGILLEEGAEEDASRVAERILDALRQPFTLAGRQVFVQASIGIATGGAHAKDDEPIETADELLRNADAAMYTAKSRGKGRFEFFEAQMHATALHRLELRAALEAALAAAEFEVHYQPIVELMTGDMVGVEALVRWPLPDGSLLLPNDFVPLAEETGLMVQLGHTVLDQACRQAAEWRALPDVDDAFTVAVNVSSRQLQDPGFAAGVAAVLTRSGLPPAALIMEVTEGALLDEGETTTTSIAGVKELGVRIALDDFGTGYSSLSHLRRFPIDILKIDRSFVAGVDGGEQGERALVQSIIRLAHSLKLETVAEGVERPAQLTQLRALGARLGQGFLFARPMAAAGITDVLRERRRMVS